MNWQRHACLVGEDNATLVSMGFSSNSYLMQHTHDFSNRLTFNPFRNTGFPTINCRSSKPV